MDGETKDFRRLVIWVQGASAVGAVTCFIIVGMSSIIFKRINDDIARNGRGLEQVKEVVGGVKESMVLIKERQEALRRIVYKE